MTQGLGGRVLCVDDEPSTLAGIALHLKRRFEVFTATNASLALATLDEQPDIAVVVSDMAMPGTNGIDLLKQVRERAPDVVRILLTGRGDLKSAIAAINDGQIFRFLTKPCPSAKLLASVGAGIEQHRLVVAERVLLEQTLRGSITVLSEVLSLANPTSFGRATRIKQLVVDLADHLTLADRWQVEVAAMFSQLGFISLPEATAERVYFDRPLEPHEVEMVARVPGVTEELLANIPRLEPVRAILRQVHEATWVSPDPAVRQAAGLLRAALDFDGLECKAYDRARALEVLRASPRPHPAEVLDALAAVRCSGEQSEPVEEIPLAGLRVGMILAEDIVTEDGTLFAVRGFEITERLVERAENFGASGVKEPIRVLVRRRRVAAE